MVKCPFCSFDNEDGALFCEQCKSDLGGAEMSAASAPPVVAMAQPVMAETIPLAPVAEVAAPMADVSSIPVAAPYSFAPPEGASAPAEAPAPPVVEPVGEAPAEMAASAPSAEPAAAAGTLPKLVVLRGLKLGIEYSVFPGENFIGRFDEKPVDIDLCDQEAEDKTWSSRQHAVIILDEASGAMTIEDLNSANGTFVNRTKVYPGQKRTLVANDVIQIGTVQMRVKG